MVQHLSQVRKELNNLQLDGLIITNPINRRYISGFTGTDGVVIITENDALFITDFRYVEQAKSEAKNYTIIEHKGTLEDELAKRIENLRIKNVGFEQDHVTFSTYKVFEEKFKANLIPTKGIIETLRMVKTDEEIAILKKAASIADKAFEHILNFISVGVSEMDIAHELEIYMRKQGATSSSFDIIVASGERSALPHGIASHKKIASGELVTLDYGALYEGYCSDITRTVAVGDVSEELYNIYHIVLEAQENAVNKISPGMTGLEADALTREIIKEKGYGDYFGHSTGHGIGLEVHEAPGLSFRSHTILEKNMVVTVEPGIYLPNVGGCRIEDDIYITEDGNERLTFANKEFIQL